MGITIKRVKNERGVRLGSLNIGDTFLHRNRVGIIVCHAGNKFPLDLSTGNEMYYEGSFPFVKSMDLDDLVLPIEVELTYKVVS